MRESATKTTSHRRGFEARYRLLTKSARRLRVRLEGVLRARRGSQTAQADYRAYPEAPRLQSVRSALAVSALLDRCLTGMPEQVADSHTTDAVYAEFVRALDYQLRQG